MKILTLIIAIVLLSGCGGYKVNYNSIPQGASLICNGTDRGYTPVRQSFDLDSEQRDSGKFTSAPCYAQWSSGVIKHYGREFDLNKWPDGVMIIAHRPDVEGYSQDANFALQVQNMKNQQQANISAEWDRLNQNIQQQNRDIQQQTQNQQLINSINRLKYRY